MRWDVCKIVNFKVEGCIIEIVDYFLIRVYVCKNFGLIDEYSKESFRSISYV